MAEYTKDISENLNVPVLTDNEAYDAGGTSSKIIVEILVVPSLGNVNAYDAGGTSKKTIKEKLLVPSLSVTTDPEVIIASFSGTPTSGDFPLEVQFSDKSSGIPTEWLWDFGDEQTSTEQNPTHTYTKVGIYDVTLTAGNGLDSSTLIVGAYIVVTDPNCVSLKEYSDELLHEVREEYPKQYFPRPLIYKWIQKDICETIIELGGNLRKRYRAIATLAVNSAAGKYCTGISHAEGSVSVTGFSGLTTDWQSLVVVKNGIIYYARIISNTETVVTIKTGTDIPILDNDVVFLTTNDGNIYVDLSSLDMLNFVDPIWLVLNGDYGVIEKMPLQSAKSIDTISKMDGKVYWYREEQKIKFALGSGAKFSGIVLVGYYKKPVEALSLTSCIDLPKEFHNLSQDKTKRHILAKKELLIGE